MIYVFREWTSYDGGGMECYEFKNHEELKQFLQQKLVGEKVEDAQKIVDGFIFVEGKRISPTVGEIIKDFEIRI
jgi:hypothetical protein